MVITTHLKSKFTMSIAAEVRTWLFWKFDKATGYKWISRKTFRNTAEKIEKRFKEKLDEQNAKITELQCDDNEQL